MQKYWGIIMALAVLISCIEEKSGNLPKKNIIAAITPSENSAT